jgi:glycosyltransferase involved in cell wall biosynthesis
MRLGVLSEQGGSIGNLAASGQDRRFIDEYLARYGRVFDEVLYFSYADETAILPPRCRIVPNAARLHRWIYSWAMPLLRARDFRRCDALRVMQLTGEVPAILGKLLYGVPFAATYGYRYSDNARADGAGRLRALLFALRTRVALRFADRIIVTNPAIRDQVVARIGAKKVAFLPNGVDVSTFVPAERPPNVEPTILFVGRLAPVKNLGLLLEAVARLDRRPKIRMIGDGPLRAELADRAARLGLMLELPGIVDHRHLPAELQAAAVFVLTSRFEGHPKALLEAMSCGCVCVATAAAGILDVLEHEVTGLIADHDPASLAAALARALDDAALRARLSRNARERAVRDFDLRTILEREVQMLAGLARSRS